MCEVEVNIYILHISLVEKNIDFVSSSVEKSRKEKAFRYIQKKDQLLSLGAGYLLKKYLPQGEIKTLENGKPYLEDGPYFNLSHSGEYVVLAIHHSFPLGVDIERIDEKKIDAIKFVLDDEEKCIDDTETLFRIWSNKESLIKCMSKTISDIKNIKGLPLDGMRNILGEDYFSKSIIYNGYSLSLSLKNKEPFEMKIKLINSLEE